MWRIEIDLNWFVFWDLLMSHGQGVFNFINPTKEELKWSVMSPLLIFLEEIMLFFLSILQYTNHHSKVSCFDWFTY